MDNIVRDAEKRGGVGSQVYTTLCVNLLSVSLVKENYDNLMWMWCNKTTQVLSCACILMLHDTFFCIFSQIIPYNGIVNLYNFHPNLYFVAVR